tara:strand:+ start:71 stop:400 length:330 start_codon:yes stop_codon:yes gene_type:complete
MNVIILLSFLLLISPSIATNIDDGDALTQFTKGATEGVITELILELLVTILPLQLVVFIFILILIIVIGYFIYDNEFRQAVYNYLFSYEGMGYITGCFVTQRITNTIKN